MQAVILAAGKSTRTYPLTITKPKPLLKVANKTILEHNLDNLNNVVDEVILIVGYKRELIKKCIGSKYKNLKIKYVEQKQQLGTAHALSMAEYLIKDRFVLMAGDDVYSKDDIKDCIEHGYSILTSKVKNPQNFGVIVEKNNILIDFIEKPKKFISNLANTSFYCLDKKIFNHLKKIKKSERNELEMPDAIKLLSKEEKIYCVNSKNWLPIVYPWDLLRADRTLRKNKNIVGKNSRIEGTVVNSAIGNGCIIEGKVSNSIIMDSTIIDKNSIIEDSVTGENVHFCGKIISKKNAFSMIKNKKINAGRLGAIIGDNCELINVAIKAGCKIWPNKNISNITIKKDIL